MIDSCSARNVEPGLAATYSKPSDLLTSSMKSDPGRSVVYTSARGGGGLVSAATKPGPGSGVTTRACGACAAAAAGSAATAGPTPGPTPGPTSAAAPAAAPFRNRRR